MFRIFAWWSDKAVGFDPARLPPRGAGSPWIPIFWGSWGSRISVSASLLLPSWPIARLPIFRKEKIHPHVRSRGCGAESFGRVLLRSYPLRRRKYPARRRELFSLRKKRTAGIRLSAWQKEGSLCRLDPTPFRPLKALKITGIQGESLPLGRSSRAEPSRSFLSTHAEILSKRLPCLISPRKNLTGNPPYATICSQ